MTPAAGLAASLEARVWAALAEINDPEMPVNLVDLGLIYGLEIGEGTVRLRLTFTAMGCPASDMIVGDIRERLLAEPGVGDVLIDVETVAPVEVVPALHLAGGRRHERGLGPRGIVAYGRLTPPASPPC